MSTRTASPFIILDKKQTMNLWVVLLVAHLGLASCTYHNASNSKKTHSGRIPSNVRFFLGNKRRRRPSLDDHGIQQLILASSIPATVDFRPEHKLLYYRALQMDYDFAQFGQPCRIFTLDELEAFLRIPQDNLEPREGQRETVSPAQKGELLDKLFNHSRTICDFRNLLTCHKHFRTCACAHPSMGLNRDGICGINIGHPCELSERLLFKYNILVTPETNPIKCLLENAECAFDDDPYSTGVNAMRKVCRCRQGYWGATCRQRPEASLFIKTPRRQQGRRQDKDKVEAVEIPSGRTMWTHEGGGALGEYFMHPEEISARLIQMMKGREMYSPEDRELEAQKLVKRLEFDVDKEEMVVNELHLRELGRLTLGEACEPERQVILDNPPVAKEGQRWIDPLPDDIKSWQLGLLQDNKPFCNIYQNFRCDEATRVCQCKPGLVLESSKVCAIPLGHNCGPDFDTRLEFDPLRDRKRFSEAFPPDCVAGLECKDQALFFEKKCWCKEEGNCTIAFPFDLVEFQNIVSALLPRFILALGDACDPKLHRDLLSFGESDGETDPGHERRLGLFREIVENPESRLCDIGSYLNCSEASRTCECWKQLKPSKKDAGECVAINMASCGRTFEYGKYMFPEGSQLWQVEKTFQIPFLPDCTPGAACAEDDNSDWAGRCVCTDNSKTGEDCRDTKSILASAFKPSLIPSDNDEEMSMIRLFFDLNRQTSFLEHLMTLTVNQACDPVEGLKVDRIVKFWKEVASSDETISGRQTLSHFVAVTKWTKYLVNTAAGNSAALCNAMLGLRCQQMNAKCGCGRGLRWIEDKCYLEIDEICDPKPGADWMATCMNGTKCNSRGRRNGHRGQFLCVECHPGRKCGDTEVDDAEMTWDVHNSREAKDIIGIVISNHSVIPSSGSHPPVRGRAMASTSNGSGDASLNWKQKNKFHEEIRRMLREILDHRFLPVGSKCNSEEERKLDEIFPELPIFDAYHLHNSISTVYSTLSRLHWAGHSFCDRKHFLKCGTNEICVCSQRFGLIERNGEWHLVGNKRCNGPNPVKKSNSSSQEWGNHEMAICTKTPNATSAFLSVTAAGRTVFTDKSNDTNGGVGGPTVFRIEQLRVVIILLSFLSIPLFTNYQFTPIFP